MKLTMAALILAISACASAPSTPAQTLGQRVQERWDALLSQDLETAYRYLSPGQRQVLRFQDYVMQQASRSVRLTSARFKEVTSCDDGVCSLKVLVGFEVSAPAGAGLYRSSQIMHENWIESDGQWYFVPEDVL